MFYDEYSSEGFLNFVAEKLNSEFVQTGPAQLETGTKKNRKMEIVQTPSAQLSSFPKVVSLTSFSNHVEILCHCKTKEQRFFYMLYANKERLNFRELKRCIKNDTFTTLLRSKKNLSKGMLKNYPQAGIAFKDELFLDFFKLTAKAFGKQTEKIYCRENEELHFGTRQQGFSFC